MREIESDEKTELKEFIVLRVWRSMTDAPEIPLTTQHPRNTQKMYEHDILFRDKSINLIFPHNWHLIVYFREFALQKFNAIKCIRKQQNG